MHNKTLNVVLAAIVFGIAVFQHLASASPVGTHPYPLNEDTGTPEAQTLHYDPLYIVPDETRLDGAPVDTFDTTTGKFEMQVCSRALGRNARVWLEAPRQKTIVVDNKTQLYAFGSPSAQIALVDLSSHSYHVTVIGSDAGVDKPLLARVVWVESASAAESAFLTRTPRCLRSCSGPEIEVVRTVVDTEGHHYPANVVQVKLSTVRVRVGLAWGHVGATESLGGIVHDYNAIAAINGSFFDAYSSSQLKLPDNELITGSNPVSRADIGTVIGFTPDGEARMESSPVADTLHNLDPAYPEQWALADTDQALYWQRVTEALGAGPRLVLDGQIDLDPAVEGYRSAEMLDGVSQRSAVGITSEGWLYLVTTSSTMDQLAHIMRALGCSQAMNLDGGSSSGLWVQGRYLRRPGRDLSNALVITSR